MCYFHSHVGNQIRYSNFLLLLETQEQHFFEIVDLKLGVDD